MKNFSYGVFVGLSLILLVAFSLNKQEVKNNAAEVNRVNSVYVFTDSYPIKQYEVLGHVKVAATWDGSYESSRNQLIKKAKKEFPNAEAIIIYPNHNGTDKADVIKFK